MSDKLSSKDLIRQTIPFIKPFSKWLIIITTILAPWYAIYQTYVNRLQQESIQNKLIEMGKVSEYERYSMEYRPEIDVYCEIDSLWLPSVAFVTVLGSDTTHLKTSVSVRLELKLTNTSEHKVFLRGHISVSNNDTSDIARNLATGVEEQIGLKKSSFTEKTYFERKFLMPGDTMIVTNTIDSVAISSTNHTIVHYLVLFENEYECLYDAYSMTLYSLIFSDIKYLIDKLNPSNSQYSLTISKIREESSKPDGRRYSMKTRDRVYQNMDSWWYSLINGDEIRDE